MQYAFVFIWEPYLFMLRICSWPWDQRPLQVGFGDHLQCWRLKLRLFELKANTLPAIPYLPDHKQYSIIERRKMKRSKLGWPPGILELAILNPVQGLSVLGLPYATAGCCEQLSQVTSFLLCIIKMCRTKPFHCDMKKGTNTHCSQSLINFRSFLIACGKFHVSGEDLRHLHLKGSPDDSHMKSGHSSTQLDEKWWAQLLMGLPLLPRG